jgi:phage terminase large subunit
MDPRRKSDAVDEFLRAPTLQNAIVVKANFLDNPFFPAALECSWTTSDRFEHIWLGEYAKAFEGLFGADENLIGSNGLLVKEQEKTSICQ